MGIKKNTLKSINYTKCSLYSVPYIIGMLIPQPSWEKADNKSIIVYADQAMLNISTTAKTYTVIDTSKPKYQYTSDALDLLKSIPGISASLALVVPMAKI